MALLVVLALGLPACRGDGPDPTSASDGGGTDGGGGQPAASTPLRERYDLSGVTISLGSKDFTEQLILGQLAKQAWEATGATVDLMENLPSPDGARDALTAGELDAAWEYTGTAWVNHLGHDEAIDDPIEQYRAVAAEDLEKNGIVWTEPAPFDDTYGIATRARFAEEHNLDALGDVAEFVEQNPGQATLCLDNTFGVRDDGLVRFEDEYGVEWPDDQKIVQEFDAIYGSTAAGDPCNFGEVFTTDGRIQALDLALMEDTGNTFISYLSAVQIAADLATEHPDVAAVIADVAAPIDEQTMTSMNASVDIDGEFPEDVAARYLRDQGFVN